MEPKFMVYNHVLQTFQIGVQVHHKAPKTWPILRDLIHSQGALVVNSLTVFNEMIMPIVNVVILYKNRKYYVEKLHLVYRLLYKPTH